MSESPNLGGMPEDMVMQGRKASGADIELIRDLRAAHPTRGRTPLSVDFCLQWNWRNAKGRLKDMAARTLLLKLERAGYILPPPRQGSSFNKLRNRSTHLVVQAQEPIRGDLSRPPAACDLAGRDGNDSGPQGSPSLLSCLV